MKTKRFLFQRKMPLAKDLLHPQPAEEKRWLFNKYFTWRTKTCVISLSPCLSRIGTTTTFFYARSNLQSESLNLAPDKVSLWLPSLGLQGDKFNENVISDSLPEHCPGLPLLCYSRSVILYHLDTIAQNCNMSTLKKMSERQTKVGNLEVFSWEPAQWTLNSQERVLVLVLLSRKNHCNSCL